MYPTKTTSPDEEFPGDRPTVPLPRLKNGRNPEPFRRPITINLSLIGRQLRFLAGVDECLLDKVHWERTWYTSLGGVVLGTATIAAFSMWFAIGEAVGVTHLGALVPVFIWFLFILNLDRWLVSSRPSDGWQRVFLFSTRAVLALLFGTVIAEPLVMRVFETKIVEFVHATRAEHLAGLEGRLEACNPDPSSGQKLPDTCTTKEVMSFAATPSATSEKLAALRADEKALQTSVTADSEKLAELNDLARRECNGTPGPGLTGQFGVGPNCRRLRTEADTYQATHPIAANIARLAELRAQVSTLETELNSSRSGFQTARDAEITKRLQDETQVVAPIGLLERMQALHSLADQNSALFWGIWLVRALFITVDCAPVLMKMASGRTYYDRLVAEELNEALEVHSSEKEAAQRDRETDDRMNRAERDLEVREHRAEMGVRLADAVDSLATTYERRHPATDQ